MAQYVVLYGMNKDHDRSEREALQTKLRDLCDWVWLLNDVWVIETGHPPTALTEILLKVGTIRAEDEFVILGLTCTGDYRNVANGVMQEWLESHVTRI